MMWRYWISGAVAVGLALCAVTADAQEAGSWYVLPSASFVRADRDRAAENDLGASVAIGKAVTANLHVDGKLSGNQMTYSVDEKWRQRGIAVDAIWMVSSSTKWSWYSVAGVGVMRNRLGERQHQNAFGELGIGGSYRVGSEGMFTRADVRVRYDADDYTLSEQQSYVDAVFNLGVVFPIAD